MAKKSGFGAVASIVIILVFAQSGQNLFGDWQFYSTVAAGTGTDNTNSFVTVNPNTGEMTLAGPKGGTPYQDHIDIDPNSGYLYGINTNTPGVITKIDINDGQWSTAATIQQDSSPVYLTALAFSPNGILYGISDYQTFGIINLAISTFTPIAELDIPGQASGMAFSPQGVLYMVDETGIGNSYKQWLRIVDASTGKIISSIRTGQCNAEDIDFAPDGYIYNTNYSWWLFKINPANGKQEDAGGGVLGPFGGIASIPSRARGQTLVYKYKGTDNRIDKDDGNSWQNYKENKSGYLIIEPNDNNTASAWFIDTWSAKDPCTQKTQKYYEQKNEKTLNFLQVQAGKSTVWIINKMDDEESIMLSGTVHSVKIGIFKPSIAATLAGTEIWDTNKDNHRDIGQNQLSIILDIPMTSDAYTHSGEDTAANIVDYLENTLKYQQGLR